MPDFFTHQNQNHLSLFCNVRKQSPLIAKLRNCTLIKLYGKNALICGTAPPTARRRKKHCLAKNFPNFGVWPFFRGRCRSLRGHDKMLFLEGYVNFCTVSRGRLLQSCRDILLYRERDAAANLASHEGAQHEAQARKKNEIENFVEPDGYKFRKRGFLVCALFLIRGPVVVSGLMLRQQHSKRLLSDSRERGFAFCIPFIGTGPFSHIFRFSRPSKINNESHMVSEWAFGSRLSVCAMKSDTLERSECMWQSGLDLATMEYLGFGS